MAYNFYIHNNLVFGKDAIQRLEFVLRSERIKNVMLIHGSSVKKAGIADIVLDQIQRAGCKVTVFDGVLPNPTNQLAEEAAKIAKEAGVEAFVAVGGGSCIDLAKAVNLLMTNPGPVGMYGGIGLVRHNVLPLVAIPTTAGTSSEVTGVTVLIDTEAVCKYAIIDNKLVPSHVIVDPEMTRTMPTSVAAATGMDAITHAVESYISNLSTPLTEYHSLQGLKIFYDNLQQVVADGNDMQAKENMMLGCIITGYGFSNANLGLVHGIAHTLSAHFDLSHGMANAAVLPYVMAYNAPSCPEKMIKMAETIGLPLTGEKEKDMYVLAEELERLTAKIGIKRLSEQNIRREDLEILAEDTMKEPVLNFNPRQGITKEDVLEILNKAF